MTEAQIMTSQTGEKKQQARARAHYLDQAIQLEEHGVPEVIKTAIYFSLCLFIALFIWAAFTQVNEVSITRGEAVPNGYIHDIQHLEGGIVSEIAVRDGDQVNPGDLLVRFAEPVSQADYEQFHIRKATLTLTMARLQATQENRKPDFGETGRQYPNLAAKEMASYYAYRASLESELNVLESQTRQKQSELRRQRNQVQALQKEIALLQKQVDMREKLTAKHVVSQTDLLTTKSQLAGTQSQIRSVQDGISVATMALQEAKNRRQEIIDRHKKEIEFKAAEIAGQLAEVEKSVIKAQDRVTRLNLYAPISGIVQGISITSINAVVKPGEVILQIVPVDKDLVVETRIMPEEVGHIHVDHHAEVKVDSYDAAKFGHINGVVKQISPSTYLDEKMNPYYLGRIELEKNYVGEDPTRMRVIPGMTVQVNIITGSKSILDYLLKPINRGFSNAFRER